MWGCYRCSGNSRVALALINLCFSFRLPDIEIFRVWEASHELIWKRAAKTFFEKCRGETFTEK